MKGCQIACVFLKLQSCHLLVDLLDDEDGVLEGLDLVEFLEKLG